MKQRILNPMSWTHIDLFAGIGGFRLAAMRNGGRCIGSNSVSVPVIEQLVRSVVAAGAFRGRHARCADEA